jgi:hypothetical protein
MPNALKQLPRNELPLLAVSLVGIEGLRYLAAQLQIPDGQFVAVSDAPTAQETTSGDSPHILTGLKPVVDDLSMRERAVIMVMGKGGVGKSTVASAIALALAEAGHKVHLSTTDPAAHLNLVLEGAGSDIGDRFVNQTWTGIRTTDPVLGKLAGLEAPWQKQVAEKLSRKTVSLPWQAVTPQGRNGLLQLL